MKDKAFELLESEGYDAAVAFMKDQPKLTEIVRLFDAVAKRVYTEKKDVGLAVALFQEGIEWGETNVDEENMSEVLGAVKGLYYDLGANTWPGWNDEGITINSDQLKIGLGAAEQNLTLAISLDKGAIPISRAHWLVGAHQLAQGDYEKAIASFEQSQSFAEEGERHDEALLALGYQKVTAIVQITEDESILQDLSEIIGQLEETEFGEFFVEQLEQSLKVFLKT